MSQARLFLTWSVSFALLVPGTVRAAIISNDNTGSAAPITILDWDGGASDPGVSDSGGGGTDGDEGDRVYGSLARWAPPSESTTYVFTGLAEGDYRIFATWLHDYPRVADGFVVANGAFVGIYTGVDTETDIGGIDISQGFIAQKNAVVDPVGSPFEYVGTGTVGSSDADTLTVVVTSSGDGFRTDAIGIQAAPEPIHTALAALGPLALMALARRSRRTRR
jgi:hypothetical protein